MARKSLKGKWGNVGAPPKNVRYPRTQFTVETAVKFNESDPCELTIRKRIKDDLKAGKLVKVGERPQPKGGVGRPSAVYALKEVAAKLKTKTPKTSAPKAVKVKASKSAPASVPVTTVTATPAASPATPEPTVNPAATPVVTPTPTA